MSDGAQSSSYDANGRLTSAGDRSYTYSLNDRLIALSQPGLSATFAYNGDGVRLAQTENGSATRYLVDTQRRYSEVVGAITPESETWYLLGLDILGQQQGSDWSYYAYDGLGSVRLALDSSGSPSAGMRYEPYGHPAASWGTPPALGFTGEWTDSSGLLYLRARYLDPSSATFLSRDPFEGLPTRALSRNGYSWVEGNPVSRSDPSGMCWDHPMSTGAQRSQCLQAWVEYASTVLLTDETRQLLRDEDEYWGSLSYTEFARLWNDNQARPPSRTNPGSEWEQLTWAAVGAAVATGPTPDDLAWLAGALCLEALRQIALARAIALPQRPLYDFDSTILESSPARVREIRERTKTLAQHLAKLLAESVAGYPPSGPNPNRDPDRGWCKTIENSVNAIKDLGLSQDQFNRDFAKTGLGEEFLSEVKNALQRARDAGWCDDHWNGFDAGPFAN